MFYVDMKLITCIALLSKENKKGSSKLASTQHITTHQKVNVSWITERCSYIIMFNCCIGTSSNCIDDIKSDEWAPNSKQDELHMVSMPSMHGPTYPT